MKRVIVITFEFEYFPRVSRAMKYHFIKCSIFEQVHNLMALPIHINTINIGSTFDVRLRYFSNWRFDVVFDPSVHNVERPTHEVAQQKVVFTCIENNLAKFPNGKLPRSFNGFLSKIRDDAETTKYWKLKKQRQNRRFLPRSIDLDYCVAKD